ncbi:MAG: entericidin A/B family lipoprotein [Rhodocyclaceae bacterium]|jgi:predicted small secreted protein|nr:entericidin A/B family lipoprotein [Rhodocyclaceae bacterium]
MKYIALIVLAASTFLVGCNTVRGIGQDIERGGEAIQRTTK